MRKIEKLEADTLNKQATLEQVRTHTTLRVGWIQTDQSGVGRIKTGHFRVGS